MKLKRTKTYTIKVDDNNNNKCSKDCEYMVNDFDLSVCIFETCTENGIHNSKVEDNNRTEYCKKFFEYKEIKK